VISLRNTLGTAALVAGAAAVTACGSHGDDGYHAADRPGCTGVCSQDGGPPEGGTPPDSGTSDAGTQASPTQMSVAQARGASSGTWVRLENVVIQTVESTTLGPQGEYRSTFWVVDPANSRQGLWVSKSSQDVPTTYVPRVGDRIDLEGWIQSRSRFEPFTAWRPQLTRLAITRLGTLTPPADHPVSLSTGFGNADGGFARPNPEYAGARVHIAGPLSLTNPNPRALQQVSDDPEDPRFFGFEVQGGILVRAYKTVGESDGGEERCDWRRKALDGGSVLFPQGLRGVWETYSYAACQDRASTDAGCLRESAVVPGTEGRDGGGNPFTYVLHPQNCETDLVGEWDAGP
jgi:hypothetical protein